MEDGPNPSTYSTMKGTAGTNLGMMCPAMTLLAVKAVCTPYSTPWEMGMRPRFGTRYLFWLAFIATWFTMQWWLLGDWAVKTFAHRVPGANPEAQIGMGTILTVYNLCCLYHAIRCHRRMRHMGPGERQRVGGRPLVVL